MFIKKESTAKINIEIYLEALLKEELLKRQNDFIDAL